MANILERATEPSFPSRSPPTTPPITAARNTSSTPKDPNGREPPAENDEKSDDRPPSVDEAYLARVRSERGTVTQRELAKTERRLSSSFGSSRDSARVMIIPPPAPRSPLINPPRAPQKTRSAKEISAFLPIFILISTHLPRIKVILSANL